MHRLVINNTLTPYTQIDMSWNVLLLSAIEFDWRAGCGATTNQHSLSSLLHQKSACGAHVQIISVMCTRICTHRYRKTSTHKIRFSLVSVSDLIVVVAVVFFTLYFTSLFCSYTLFCLFIFFWMFFFSLCFCRCLQTLHTKLFTSSESTNNSICLNCTSEQIQRNYKFIKWINAHSFTHSRIV